MSDEHEKRPSGAGGGSPALPEDFSGSVSPDARARSAAHAAKEAALAGDEIAVESELHRLNRLAGGDVPPSVRGRARLAKTRGADAVIEPRRAKGDSR